MDPHSVAQTVYHALLGAAALADLLRATPLEQLSLLPANPDLIGAEVELISALARENKLKAALGEVAGAFDYILIDCPPSLGLLTINALTAANKVLIPLQCEYYAMEGMSQLMNTVRLIQRELNPGLVVLGILLTMFDGRNNLSHQVSDEIRQHFSAQVFETMIPRNVRLSEAPSHGVPALLYDISSRGATAYLELAREIIRQEQ